MGNVAQLEQDVSNSTSCRRGGYHYKNATTVKKSTFKSNIADRKGAMFTQGGPSDAAKYEDSIEVLINYAQCNYLAGVYLGQDIRYGNVPDLELPNKPTKYDNKSDAKFDMEVYE